ncbi:MAG: hypothetical protein ACRDTE_17295 [Pseudonocardiaceae bacterium]
MSRGLSLTLLAGATLVLLEVVLVGGAQGNEGFEEPGGPPEQAAVSFTPPPPREPQSGITRVVEQNKARLFEIEGVHGVSEGRSPIGDAAVRIDIDYESVRDRLPQEIEGYPVETVVVPGGFGILPAGSPYRG